MRIQTFLFGTKHFKYPLINHSSFPSDECGTFHMKQICKGYEYYLDL